MVNGLKHLRDGIFTFSLLTKHILLASRCIEIHTGHACPLLTAIVLLLHHQIELVQPIAPSAVLLFVITQRRRIIATPHSCFSCSIYTCFDKRHKQRMRMQHRR